VRVRKTSLLVHLAELSAVSDQLNTGKKQPPLTECNQIASTYL